MRAPQGFLEQLPPAPLELVARGILNEAASVLIQAVDVAYQLGGQRDGDTFVHR
jgi:hypothetical protein